MTAAPAPSAPPPTAAPSRDELVHKHQGLVRSLAWKIHQRVRRHVELDDLVGHGQVGLVKAAEEFDPARGVMFSTYAYHRIRGAIFDGLGTYRWFSKQRYFQGRFESVANEHLDAATEEAADDGRWFVETTRSIATVHLSCELADAARSRDEPGPAEVDRGEMLDLLRDALETLPATARALIDEVYFGGSSITAFAESRGMSKSWGSRLHSRTLATLFKRVSAP